MLAMALMIVALILFLIASSGRVATQIDLTALGLAFLTGSLLVGLMHP